MTLDSSEPHLQHVQNSVAEPAQRLPRPMPQPPTAPAAPAAACPQGWAMWGPTTMAPTTLAPTMWAPATWETSTWEQGVWGATCRGSTPRGRPRCTLRAYRASQPIKRCDSCGGSAARPPSSPSLSPSLSVSSGQAVFYLYDKLKKATEATLTGSRGEGSKGRGGGQKAGGHLVGCRRRKRQLNQKGGEGGVPL